MKAKIIDHYVTSNEDYINAYIVFETTNSESYLLESAFKKGEGPNKFLESAIKECATSSEPITTLSVIGLSKDVSEKVLDLKTEFDIMINDRKQVSRVKKRSDYNSLLAEFNK